MCKICSFIKKNFHVFRVQIGFKVLNISSASFLRCFTSVEALLDLFKVDYNHW